MSCSVYLHMHISAACRLQIKHNNATLLSGLIPWQTVCFFVNSENKSMLWILMCESEALWWKNYYQNHHTLVPFPRRWRWGAIKLWWREVSDPAPADIHTHIRARVTHARTHWRANRRVYSSSGSARQAPAIRWYQEVMAQNTSLTNSNYLH